MKKQSVLAVIIAASMAGSAYAIPTGFEVAFNEGAADIADTAEPVRGVQLVAGVDTDGDGNEEIVYARIIGGATNAAELYIYENTGDNAYSLAYSQTFTVKGAPANGSLGGLVVADADDTAGDEIYLFASGPDAAAGDSLFVVYSTGANTWASVNVAPPIPTLTAGNANSTGTAVEFTSAAAGDPDDDGNIELVVTDDVTDGTFIWEVNGSWPTATLSASEPNTMYRSTANPAPGPAAAAGQLGGSKYNVFLYDLNNDGREDILSATWNNLGFGVWEGTAANTYTRAFVQDAGPATADQPPMSNTTTAGNVDGTGLPTAFVGNSRTADIFAFPGTDPLSGMVPLSSGGFTLGGGTGGLELTAAAGANSFEQHPLQSLTLADTDANGNAEFVLAINPELTPPATGGEVVLIEYNGAGADTDGANYTVHRGADTGLLTATAARGAVAGTVDAILDMDGDGLAEIVAVTAGAAGSAIYVFEDEGASVGDWSMF